MAKVASVNVDCAANGGADAIWNLVNLLLSNGWTRVADSDGTTYRGSAPFQITGAGSGGNGLNNANAWIMIQDPSGGTGRKYLFQRGSNNYSWWIRYVRSATLNTAGNATTMPTNPSVANDLQNLNGTAATGTALFNSTTGYYAHAVAETAPSYGVYQFWFGTTLKLSGTWAGAGYVLGLDTTTVSGGLDQDPSVSKIGTANTAGSNSSVSMWQYYGMASPSPAWTAVGTRIFPAALSVVNQYTGNDDMFPILLLPPATGTGSGAAYKGQATWIRSGGMMRDYPSTVNLTTDAYLYMQGNSSSTHIILLPWPENVTPQL